MSTENHTRKGKTLGRKEEKKEKKKKKKNTSYS
jgi:hypothetical protein